MGKIEQERTRYARVMHHIGGHDGSSAAADMIRGGEDELNLLNEEQVRNLAESGVDVKRLFDLGAMREANADEIYRWEVAKGIRTAAPDSKFFADFTSGADVLHSEVGGVVGADLNDSKVAGSAVNSSSVTNPFLEGTGGEPSGGHIDATKNAASQGYKGMTKGELSEYTVPELKEMAKEESIEGSATMLKDDLLNALVALGK